MNKDELIKLNLSSIDKLKKQQYNSAIKIVDKVMKSLKDNADRGTLKFPYKFYYYIGGDKENYNELSKIRYKFIEEELNKLGIYSVRCRDTDTRSDFIVVYDRKINPIKRLFVSEFSSRP